MQVLQNFSLFISTLVCVVVLFIILIQAGKGGSLGIFGGGSSSSAFGASTMDVLTKFTWWMVLIFFCVATFSAIMFAEGSPSYDKASEIQAEGEAGAISDFESDSEAESTSGTESDTEPDSESSTKSGAESESAK